MRYFFYTASEGVTELELISQVNWIFLFRIRKFGFNTLYLLSKLPRLSVNNICIQFLCEKCTLGVMLFNIQQKVTVYFYECGSLTNYSLFLFLYNHTFF